MSDLSDVENSLVTLIASTLYPSGPSNPSITGFPARVYRGWPNSDKLDLDLRAGNSHVTVIEAAGYSRLTGGYIDNTPLDVPGVPTLTATVNLNTVTIGGTAGAGQLVGLMVAGASYAYSLTGGDTLTTAATALAALVNAGPLVEVPGNPPTWVASPQVISASSAGPVITLATTLTIVARTGARGTSQVRPRWQCQGVKITAWTPTFTARDAICSALDAVLSNTPWLALPDNQQARLEWRNSYSDDVTQRELLWRRDLLYTAQFATSITTPAYPLLFPEASLNGSATNQLAPAGDTLTLIDGETFSLIG